MRAVSALVGVVLLVASTASSQTSTNRAWQQRLSLEIPLPVPAVELESVNPFALPVDQPPNLLTSASPAKIPVAGPALIAAYVDAKGECLGAVPLDLPFPGLTSEIVEELTGKRFEPARIGSAPAPSWVVLQARLEGRVKESEAAASQFTLPDPTTPPTPSQPSTVSPSGQLLRMPVTRAADLTSLATPKRFKIKTPGQEAEIVISALVHVTPDGLCDRFVPLDLPSGLTPWLSAYLATWRLEPATLNGQSVESWVIYSGRVRLKISGLSSTEIRTLADVIYDPFEHAGEQ